MVVPVWKIRTRVADSSERIAALVYQADAALIANLINVLFVEGNAGTDAVSRAFMGEEYKQ